MIDEITPIEKMKEAVAFYRKLDFFRNYDKLTDEKCIEKLEEITENIYFNHIWDELYGDGRNNDLGLVSLDKERVLWHDREICPEDLVSFVEALGSISHGQFKPLEIALAEIGVDDYYVTMLIEGNKSEIRYKQQSFIEVSFIEEINKLLIKKKQRFEVVEANQDFCIIFLSEEDKEKMVNTRKFKFLTLNSLSTVILSEAKN